MKDSWELLICAHVARGNNNTPPATRMHFLRVTQATDMAIRPHLSRILILVSYLCKKKKKKKKKKFPSGSNFLFTCAPDA
jgi:hypothetical protein